MSAQSFKRMHRSILKQYRSAFHRKYQVDLPRDKRCPIRSRILAATM